MGRQRRWAVLVFALMGSVGFLLYGCGGKGSSNTTPPPPVPQIQNINSSTTPTSPVGLPIEINGSGFQAAPGKVTFSQGSTSVDVTPASSAWSDTGVVAVVPATLTAPGTVTVTVVTSGGTSNKVTVNLVVTGGFDGSKNTNTVWAINLNQDGTVGSTTNTTWTTITTNPLPTTLAHHAMAEADDTNSLVAAGKRYIYVVGGQVNLTDVPGTNTVYVASVDSTAGTVGPWTASTNTLPKPLLGLSATVHNGFLYVAGGLDTNGNPVKDVYSAPVNADGTIGTWTTATNTLPAARAFGTMFVFGGIIYYINGDPNASLLPNSQGVGDPAVYYASAVRGVVGAWTVNANSTPANRAKGVLYTAYGQVIAGEGIYSGNPGSKEMETSTVNANNTTNAALNPWTGLTGTTDPGANVYNAAGFTSPLFAPTTNGPRFLLLGGQAFTATTGPGGALSATVHVNT